jgi:hypothetical protein
MKRLKIEESSLNRDEEGKSMSELILIVWDIKTKFGLILFISDILVILSS